MVGVVGADLGGADETRTGRHLVGDGGFGDLAAAVGCRAQLHEAGRDPPRLAMGDGAPTGRGLVEVQDDAYEDPGNLTLGAQDRTERDNPSRRAFDVEVVHSEYPLRCRLASGAIDEGAPPRRTVGFDDGGGAGAAGVGSGEPAQPVRGVPQRGAAFVVDHRLDAPVAEGDEVAPRWRRRHRVPFGGVDGRVIGAVGERRQPVIVDPLAVGAHATVLNASALAGLVTVKAVTAASSKPLERMTPAKRPGRKPMPGAPP